MGLKLVRRSKFKEEEEGKEKREGRRQVGRMEEGKNVIILFSSTFLLVVFPLEFLRRYGIQNNTNKNSTRRIYDLINTSATQNIFFFFVFELNGN